MKEQLQRKRKIWYTSLKNNTKKTFKKGKNNFFIKQFTLIAINQYF